METWNNDQPKEFQTKTLPSIQKRYITTQLWVRDTQSANNKPNVSDQERIHLDESFGEFSFSCVYKVLFIWRSQNGTYPQMSPEPYKENYSPRFSWAAKADALLKTKG